MFRFIPKEKEKFFLALGAASVSVLQFFYYLFFLIDGGFEANAFLYMLIYPALAVFVYWAYKKDNDRFFHFGLILYFGGLVLSSLPNAIGTLADLGDMFDFKATCGLYGLFANMLLPFAFVIFLVFVALVAFGGLENGAKFYDLCSFIIAGAALLALIFTIVYVIDIKAPFYAVMMTLVTIANICLGTAYLGTQTR